MADTLPGLLAPPDSGAIMRAIQRRTMRGLDPTPEQSAWLEAQRPRFEANSNAIADMFTPFPAIGEAVNDPSLANITNAGVKTAAMAGKPLAALGVLASGYGAAGAKDAGLPGLLAPSAANAETAAEARARARAAAAEGKAATQKATAEADILRARTEAERLSAEQRKREADEALERARKEAEQAEYDRAVKKAEGVRDFELSRNRRFSDTEIGKLWDKTGGMAPLLAGATLGAASKAATGGGSAFYNYGLPAILGGTAGATAPNLPLAYNAFYTEPDNPERRAYEAYARELPPTHPRRQEWTDYARTLPEANPVRAAAASELYDPVKAAERMLFGAVEGVGGGMLGADAVRILGKAGRGVAAAPGSIVEGAAELPGRAAQGYARGMTGAEHETLLRDFSQIKNKIAEAKGFRMDAEAEAALAAARARANAAGPTPVVPVSPPTLQAVETAADTPAARALRYLGQK